MDAFQYGRPFPTEVWAFGLDRLVAIISGHGNKFGTLFAFFQKTIVAAGCDDPNARMARLDDTQLRELPT